MTFIHAENLTKTFGAGRGALRASDGISFSLERGGVLGLLGPNGAGKTTLIKQLTGLLRPDSGRVLIGGLDPAQDPPGLRGRLGLLLEGMRNVYPYLTGRANLVYFGYLAGLGRDEAARRAADLLDRFGLAAAADKYVMAYSAGMNRKLAVATCLMGSADLIILDEPTAGLDSAAADDLAGLVAELAGSGGRTFILAGHDMRFMARAAREVLWLKEGRVRLYGRAEEVTALPAYRTVKLSLRGSVPLRARLTEAGAEFAEEGGVLSVRLDPAGRRARNNEPPAPQVPGAMSPGPGTDSGQSRPDPAAAGPLLAELLSSGDLLSVSGGGDLEEAFREISRDTAQG
ncbi:MAG: ABC-2 type transport system ATP-binding protein [Elusimicrobia bacterium]|nr:MAG: ABC-2 type transport system ATP-binding protein [Elusimicrobiota bacterium]KAF0154655.1 MAG: ABC-2 type transport system ATP-binding protein [Elusimicrobiota bacterium]